VWYLFAMWAFVVPVFLAAGWVHKWRMGLIGMLIPLVVLLQYTWYAPRYRSTTIPQHHSRSSLQGARTRGRAGPALPVLLHVWHSPLRCADRALPKPLHPLQRHLSGLVGERPDWQPNRVPCQSLVCRLSNQRHQVGV
jgi:hypothetical protein